MPPVSAIEKLLNSARKSDSHGYQPYQGTPELKQAIAEFSGRKLNIQLDQTEILPLLGSKEGITHISLAYLNPDDKVLIPSVGYPTYTSVTKLVGAQPVYFPLVEENGWEPNWNFLEEQDDPSIKIIWLNYPHMPTGTRGSKELLEKFVKLAKKKEWLICHDNPYSFILNENPVSFLSVDSTFDHCLELNSLSKSHNMAGWRVGMVVGSKKNIDTILKVKSNIDSGMYYGIQKGAIEALSLNSSWYTSLNKIYRKRREIVYKICDKLKLTYDKNSSGMFVWAKIKSLDISSVEFVDNLLYNKEIFITPGSIFGTNGEGYVRLSLCLSQEKLNEALNKLL